MSFTDQRPRTATERDLATRWMGGKPGEYFRCCMCGHRFAVGDYWRWVYTNGTPGAGGNPIVCEGCDGMDVIGRWKAKIEQHYSDANWYFNRRSEP